MVKGSKLIRRLNDFLGRPKLTKRQREIVAAACLTLPALNPDELPNNAEERELAETAFASFAAELERRITTREALSLLNIGDTADIWILVAQLTVDSGQLDKLTERWQLLCRTYTTQVGRNPNFERFRFPVYCRNGFLEGMMSADASRPWMATTLRVCTAALGVARPHISQEEGFHDASNVLTDLDQALNSYIKRSAGFIGIDVLLTEAERVRKLRCPVAVIETLNYAIYSILAARFNAAFLTCLLGELNRLFPEQPSSPKVLEALQALQV